VENPFRAERVAAEIARQRAREEVERLRRERLDAERFARQLRALGSRTRARWIIAGCALSFVGLVCVARIARHARRADVSPHESAGGAAIATASSASRTSTPSPERADLTVRIDKSRCGFLSEREERAASVVAAVVTVTPDGRTLRVDVDPAYEGTGTHTCIAGHAMTMRFGPGDERKIPIRFELVRM
jgi:hypothetical protein